MFSVRSFFAPQGKLEFFFKCNIHTIWKVKQNHIFSFCGLYARSFLLTPTPPSSCSIGWLLFSCHYGDGLCGLACRWRLQGPTRVSLGWLIHGAISRSAPKPAGTNTSPRTSSENTNTAGSDVSAQPVGSTWFSDGCWKAENIWPIKIFSAPIFWRQNWIEKLPGYLLLFLILHYNVVGGATCRLCNYHFNQYLLGMQNHLLGNHGRFVSQSCFAVETNIMLLKTNIWDFN